jgi:hypothetical protein
MPESLAELEYRRSAIIARIVQLGDFRPGSITRTFGRCGKPNCRCHRPGQPGHGPHIRLTYKVRGKTISESLSTLLAQRAVERQVVRYRAFQRLAREFVEINIRICRLRPLDESTPKEATGPSVPLRLGD